MAVSTTCIIAAGNLIVLRRLLIRRRRIAIFLLLQLDGRQGRHYVGREAKHDIKPGHQKHPPQHRLNVAKNQRLSLLYQGPTKFQEN